jgi:hypothetical protein
LGALSPTREADHGDTSRAHESPPGTGAPRASEADGRVACLDRTR